MTIKSEAVKEAKSALKSMSKKKDTRLTKAEFVASLINEIHTKMEAGFQLDEICEELNKTLPDDQQIKPNTFRTYVRNAREEAGIKPLRNWTRRTEKPTPNATKQKNEGVDKDTTKNIAKTKTEDEFRNMSGDL